MLNLVALQGRLTSDPELRQTPQGVQMVRFTLAVDRNFAKQGEERKADFINCIAWRNTAEFISRYFHKGSPMVLNGSIQTGSYDDKETGKKRYTFDVVVDNVNFSQGEANRQGGSAPTYTDNRNTQAPAQNSVDDFVIESDDGLPF